VISGKLFTTNDKSPFMSRFDDWDDPMSTFALLGIILGFSFLVVLVVKMPLMAAVVVFGLVFVSILWWASNRSVASDGEEEATRERDPLTVLKERYARGEISEETFEHRVTMLLDVDEMAGNEQEAELVAEQN
jgi:uncharacterized membrane protein